MQQHASALRPRRGQQNLAAVEVWPGDPATLCFPGAMRRASDFPFAAPSAKTKGASVGSLVRILDPEPRSGMCVLVVLSLTRRAPAPCVPAAGRGLRGVSRRRKWAHSLSQRAPGYGCWLEGKNFTWRAHDVLRVIKHRLCRPAVLLVTTTGTSHTCTSSRWFGGRSAPAACRARHKYRQSS